MYKRLIFLLVIGFCGTWVISGDYEQKTLTLVFNTDTSGDTAQNMAMIVGQGIDSFTYFDTFISGSDTTVPSWTSPLQSITITPVHATATYSCSVAFASEDTLEFAIVLDGSDTTTALIVDSLVYFFNNTTDLEDSVVAHDSVTYVKVISLFSEVTFGGRWELQFDVTSTGDLDTASTITTPEMAGDSLAAALNAAAPTIYNAVPPLVTDSFYIIARDAGKPFTLIFGDTVTDNGDTATFQVNVTSWSSKTDTIESLLSLVGRRYEPSLYPEIIKLTLKASSTTDAGIGLSDSGYLWLYTVFDDEYHLLAADTADSLPFTLRQPYTGSEADSLFKPKLALVWRIADTSTSEVVGSIRYDLDLTYLLGTK